MGDDVFVDPADHPQTLGDAAMATTGGVPPIAGYPLTNPAIGCLEYAWLAPGPDAAGPGRGLLQLSITKLPFDRAGIFLVDSGRDLLCGTWSVDEEGAIVPIPNTVLRTQRRLRNGHSEAAQVA